MIVFDLKCVSGHVFEAWFGSSEDYEAQRARLLVACPVCDNGQIEKAVMAPAVPKKGNRGAGGAHAAPSSGDMKRVLAAMAEVQAKVEANSEYVGDRFADEARAIHLGEVEKRGIYGQATLADAAALRDEGIEVAALPFKPRRAADA